jgi:uncharacterized protein YndB with AHSA1/START domain
MAEIKHQISIDAAAKEVYAALASQAGLRSWWTADAKSDGKVGGKAEFGFERRRVVFHMKIERLVPGKLVVWSCRSDYAAWNGTRLTWRLAREGGATVLRFTHSGWTSSGDSYRTCNTTWGALMYRLKDYLEGKKPGPHWRE